MEMINSESDIKTCIALIDYENCSNLKNISLKEYAELIIFAGPLQQSIALPVNTFPDSVKISIRQIRGVSKNNVDFHLVLELGQMICCGEKGRIYHIISADKGYDGIIQTLRGRGIACCRITPEQSIPATPPVVCIDVVMCWADKVQLSARKPHKMPVSVKSLNNYLKSQMQGEWNETLVKDIREELIRRRVMKIQGDKITW